MADEPKLMARLGWRALSSDEEARASLQERLIVLSRIMFWSFVVVPIGMVLLYYSYPNVEPHYNRIIYRIAAAGCALLGVIWRVVLVRRQLSLFWLYAIDVFYGASSGIVFGSAAFLAFDFRMSQLINLVWAIITMFVRTIVLPSTGRRTIAVCVAMFVPLVAAATGLVIVWARKGLPQELPGEAYVGGMAMIATVVTVVAAIGSRIIYGLRRQVSAAMRLGQYTLDAKIGAGGNGEVYRAHHAMLRRPTAIKLIRPDKLDAQTLDRFEREVQHMSQLTHPNTVAVFDYGRNPEGIFYYAMEYLDGINLEQLVLNFGLQPNDRVIAILVQVCGALREAHTRHIIHRDIKPANIILCERGDVPDVAKVVDFGLAKELTAESGETTRGILGTPTYLAPEVITNPEAVGPGADLYALGCVGYFLLTGRRVFDGKTTVDVCVQHVTATPVPPSQHNPKVSPELEKIILACLGKKPELRPKDAATLAQLLRALPPHGDWTEEAAVKWWSEHRHGGLAAESIPTITMTINVDKRADAPAAEEPEKQTG